MNKKNLKWFTKKNLDKTAIYFLINDVMFVINNDLSHIKYEMHLTIKGDLITQAILELKDAFFYVYKYNNTDDAIILNTVFDYIYIHKKDDNKELKNIMIHILTKDFIL